MITDIIIDITQLEPNQGQIAGVPSNPRKISDEKMEALRRSIQNLPDMLSLRGLLVYPVAEKFVIIGGNMRFLACKGLGYTKLPCRIIPKDLPAEKLRAIAMQDNNSYGETNWDMVAAEWNIDELKSWSIDLPAEWDVSPDSYGDSFSLPDGDKKPFRQMTFTFANEQAKLIESCIGDVECFETFGNENRNGNALYEIVRQWAELKKL